MSRNQTKVVSQPEIPETFTAKLMKTMRFWKRWTSKLPFLLNAG